MHRPSIVSTSTRLFRDFGGQVAISLAASAVAAAFLAAPELLVAADETPQARAVRQGDEPAGWLSPIAPDGKIATRHRQAGGIATADVRFAPALLTPATLAMPMSAAWPQAVFDGTSMMTGRTRSADAHPVVASPTPPRKASAPQERSKPADAMPTRIVPLPLATQDAAAATATHASAPPSPQPSLRVRIGDAMSGAVGTVGAAGIWTLSQASSLLPRL